MRTGKLFMLATNPPSWKQQIIVLCHWLNIDQWESTLVFCSWSVIFAPLVIAEMNRTIECALFMHHINTVNLVEKETWIEILFQLFRYCEYYTTNGNALGHKISRGKLGNRCMMLAAFGLCVLCLLSIKLVVILIYIGLLVTRELWLITKHVKC